MAGFMLKTMSFSIFILAFAQLGAGITLEHTAELEETVSVSSSAMMRRESGMKDSSISEIEEGAASVRVHVPPSSDVHDIHPRELVRSKQSSDQADLCNDNYVRGAINQSDCPRPEPFQRRMEEASMCMEAAKEKCPEKCAGCGYACIGDPFTLGDSYFNNYPARCFMTKDTGMWHFNPVGYEPNMLAHGDTAISYPVCVEPEYHNGTDNANGGCPDGFAVITHEDSCRTAATCLAYCPEEQFRVLNSTDDHDTPLGCHINANDGCVKFNTQIVSSGTIRGTPICNLTLPRGSEQTEDNIGGGGTEAPVTEAPTDAGGR